MQLVDYGYQLPIDTGQLSHLIHQNEMECVELYGFDDLKLD